MDSLERLKQKSNRLKNSQEGIRIFNEKLNAVVTTFGEQCSTVGDVIRPIQERTSDIRRTHHDVLTGKYLEKFSTIISHFDCIREVEEVICKGPTEDSNGFLKAFDQLLSIKRSETNESAIKDVDRLLSDAAEKAKTEFNRMLIEHRDARSNALQQTLHRLGVENITKDELQEMQWDTIKAKISCWIEVMQLSVTVLFSGERKLCNEIFEGINKSFLDQCFMEATSSSLALLRSFVEAVVEIKVSHDNLFELLNLYEAICKLQPEMEAMFVNTERNEMMHWFTVRTRFVTMSAKIFIGYWKVVEMDSSKTIEDGSVDLHCIHTMNFIGSLLNYKALLTNLLEEYNTGDQEEGFQFRSSILRILKSLQINIEKKSDKYKSPGQSHFFMMNNINYMVISVSKNDAAKVLLGDNWIEEQRQFAAYNRGQYESVAWAKVLKSLQVPSGDSSNSRTLKRVIRKRFKTFIKHFKEQCGLQRLWGVHDPVLCKDVRDSVIGLLIPAYSSLSQHFGMLIENTNWAKYSIEDVQAELDKLFEGEDAVKRYSIS